jgi:hypothetical protein
VIRRAVLIHARVSGVDSYVKLCSNERQVDLWCTTEAILAYVFGSNSFKFCYGHGGSHTVLLLTHMSDP